MGLGIARVRARARARVGDLEIEIEIADLARAVLKVEQQRVGRKQHWR